ncbi:hypothetical protein [Microcoleus sp. AT3-D2]|uniref:hypothetical protein n=1 Tax=Microcoleus sp. AT3-D2 TaxID=2818612 RepID=UPI002FD4B98A
MPQNPRLDGRQKQALINELLIQASKNIQNIESSISVTACWSQPRCFISKHYPTAAAAKHNRAYPNKFVRSRCMTVSEGTG